MLATAAGSSLEAAHWVQVSAGLPFSDVSGFELSPDGRWAVFAQDAEVDGARELWSAPSFGGPPRRISGALPSGASILSFAITPDSKRVVYVAPEDASGVFELFQVPIAGGARTKLSGFLVAGGDVLDFQLAAGGGSVVYRADAEVDERVELYSVSISGGTPAKLNQPLVAGGDVTSYLVAPAPYSGHVLFVADDRADNVFELYHSLIPGPGVRMSGPLAPGGDVVGYAVSADGTTVAYRADQDSDNVFEVYALTIFGGGGPTWKVNDPLVAGGDVLDFAVSANGDHVVYRADQQTDGVTELYSAPWQGGGATRLNGNLVSGGEVASCEISSDSSRVVYRADQASDEVYELYSVPILGGAATRLNGTLVAGGDVTDFAISPENDWVVYVADQIIDGYPMGFRVPVAGPAASGATIWLEAFAVDWAIDAPRGRVIVRGNEALVDSIVRLWSFPLEGTPAPNAGEELVAKSAFDPNGDVDATQVGADGAILYRGDQTTDTETALYAITTFVFWDDFESGDLTAW